MTCCHRWELSHFQLGIVRGECNGCGAVKFSPEGIYDLRDKELMARIESLNKERAMEGKTSEESKHSEIEKAPPKPKGDAAMRKYYEANKAAIVADFKQFGAAYLKKKWGIGSSTWKRRNKAGKLSGMAVRFGLLEAGPAKSTETVAERVIKEVPIPVAGADIIVLQDLDFACLTEGENERLWAIIGKVMKQRGIRKLHGQISLRPSV